jgi:hypothetical protein
VVGQARVGGEGMAGEAGAGHVPPILGGDGAGRPYRPQAPCQSCPSLRQQDDGPGQLLEEAGPGPPRTRRYNGPFTLSDHRCNATLF